MKTFSCCKTTISTLQECKKKEEKLRVNESIAQIIYLLSLRCFVRTGCVPRSLFRVRTIAAKVTYTLQHRLLKDYLFNRSYRVKVTSYMACNSILATTLYIHPLLVVYVDTKSRWLLSMNEFRMIGHTWGQICTLVRSSIKSNATSESAVYSQHFVGRIGVKLRGT